MKRPNRQLLLAPLHIHFCFLSIILIICSSGVIATANYLAVSKSVSSSTTQLFYTITQSTHNLITEKLSKAKVVVSLLREQQVNFDNEVKIKALTRRLWRQLKPIPGCEAIYIANNKGDFLLVRRTQQATPLFKSQPPESSFSVTRVFAGNDKKAHHSFYSETFLFINSFDDDNFNFTPTMRPWYQKAQTSNSPITTDVYQFHTTQELGLSIACSSVSKDMVVGMDVSLSYIRKLLTRHVSPGDSHLAIADMKNRILIENESKKNSVRTKQERHHLYRKALSLKHNEGELYEFTYKDEEWVSLACPVGTPSDLQFNLLFVSPKNELLKPVFKSRNNAVILTIVIVLLLLPISWYISKQLAKPLRELDKEIQSVRDFNFDSQLRLSSSVREIESLATNFGIMKNTIQKLQTLSQELLGKQPFDQLLTRIVRETIQLSHASAGAIYLIDDNDESLKRTTVHSPNLTLNQLDSALTSIENHNLIIPNTDDKIRYSSLPPESIPEEISDYLKEHNTSPPYLITINLHNRVNDRIGVLLLTIPHTTFESDQNHMISFINTLASFAALAIEGQLLIEQQKTLLESFIQLIAGAIDAKSPHTGGHCQRVPELTMMIVKAACENESESYKNFNLTKDQWEELRIASWLHDCGKITTPEYVVDKSTKLETIYNRIHEIRMRFEVLKRDADIEYWKGVANGKDKTKLQNVRKQIHRQLTEDFELVAQCNVGGESLSEEVKNRLEEIASKTWERTLNDKVGLSYEELEAKNRVPEEDLPSVEYLLSDKEEHIIYRTTDDIRNDKDKLGIKMKVPEYQLNKGELYNLSVERGTLTEEERFIINNHIIQTLEMLNKLPFPNYLKEVPDLAGSHHERMDGKGYPRMINADSLPLPARAMAIADIFEALTASDRPYKKAMTIDNALTIMANMADSGHIDKQLLTLMIEEGVTKEYGRLFLTAEQQN